MKNILAEFCLKSRHIEESSSKAKYLISLLEGVKFPTLEDHGFQSLDDTLKIFMQNKGRNYLLLLLKHYLEIGSFDHPAEKTDMVYRLDSFNSLKEMLVKEFNEEDKATAR